MKRVLIGPSQFKVSNPGYDASTATEAQLCFDAFGAGAFNGVYLSGRITMSPLNANQVRGIVTFGRTFAAPPQAYVRPLSTDGTTFLRDWDNQKAGSSDSTFYGASVTTTQLIVTVNFSGSTFTPYVPFGYVIFQY